MERYKVYTVDNQGDYSMIYLEGKELKHHDEHEIQIDDVIIEFPPKTKIRKIKQL